MEVTLFKKKIDLIKIKEVVIGLIGTAALAATIVLFCNAQNAVYQTHKDIWYAKALFMLAAFLFVTQRVRLFNWQSLVASVLYLPLGYMYREARSFAPDLFNRDRVVVWVVWILLMIVVDMAVYKKHTPLEKFHKGALALFAATAVFMIFFRNGRNYPIMLVIAFVFYMIPLSSDSWKKLTNRFSYGWLAAFVIMLVRSIVNNPQVNDYNGRWYGDFLNIGDFGLFMGCVMAVVLYKLYQIKKEKGRKSVEYVLWIVALLAALWTTFRVSTVTAFIGIALIVLAGLIVVRKEITVKKAIFSTVVVVVAVLLVAVAGFFTLKALANTDAEYWNQMLVEGNTLVKPLADIIDRAHYMFSEPITFADSGIFEADSFINYVDLFTSGRLSIIKVFSEYFNFSGNVSMGMQVGTYFAYNTHNTYSQLIFDYGYIGGGLFILWLLYCLVSSAGQYIKEKKNVQVVGVLWMAMTLGVLLGESANLYVPVMVMTLIITYPVLVKVDEKMV